MEDYSQHPVARPAGLTSVVATNSSGTNLNCAKHKPEGREAVIAQRKFVTSVSNLYQEVETQLFRLCESGSHTTSEVKNLPNNIADDPIKNLYGYWKIIGDRGNGITAWSEEQFQKFIGQALFFGPNNAKILTYCALHDCQSPKYSFSREENVADYLYGFRTTPDRMGIKTATLDVIDLTCKDKNNMPGTGDGAFIFLINKNTIIYTSEGTFFYLHKVLSVDKKD